MIKLMALCETDGEKLLPESYSAVDFAQKWSALGGGSFDLLVLGGAGIAEEAKALHGFGAQTIWIAESPELQHLTAERAAAVVSTVMQQAAATALAGASSSTGRDVLPRIAGLLDLPMVSNVLAIEKAEGTGRLQYQRPMFAGNLLATVEIDGEGAVFSVRGTSFGKPSQSGVESSVSPVAVDAAALPGAALWIGLESGEQKRPELTQARVVVSGGRPLRDAQTFERLLGGLADRLGGAVGATRAAVDSGIAPNELQVGQTGKVVAPELYIAAGVSGSVQHLAGMKESKVIVAINNDPEAPIFQVADYGLVADLHQAIPELTEKLPRQAAR